MALIQQMLYGPFVDTPKTPFSSFVSRLLILKSAILTPFGIIISFIIGTILFLITHKKIFIIIPFILTILFLLTEKLGIVIF